MKGLHQNVYFLSFQWSNLTESCDGVTFEVAMIFAPVYEIRIQQITVSSSR